MQIKHGLRNLGSDSHKWVDGNSEVQRKTGVATCLYSNEACIQISVHQNI